MYNKKHNMERIKGFHVKNKGTSDATHQLTVSNTIFAAQKQFPI